MSDDQQAARKAGDNASGRIADPEAYKAASKPRSADEAKAAIEDFATELAELRAKYGITELLYVVAVRIPEGHLPAAGFRGNMNNAVPLALHAVAYFRGQRDLDEARMGGFFEPEGL